MEETKNDKIEISKAEWDALQNTLSKLEYSADKGRVAKWESSHAADKEKSVSLHREGDKIVTSWKVLKDERVMDPRTSKQTGEYQEIEVTFNDGSVKQIVGYVNFANFLYNEEVQVKVIGEMKGRDGSVMLKVALPDGKGELEISSKYVN